MTDTLSMTAFDTRPCLLGEGPLWHPERQQFFWFDILENRLLSRAGEDALSWDFDENVSAAGWTGQDTLLIASETQLFEFNLETGSRTKVAPLEADNPATRSNDGRADPQGGFWIGTMAKRGNPPQGTIYRYYRGEVRALYHNIQIPNSMSFSPDGTTAYFCDTNDGRIFAQSLDERGWPKGEPRLFCNPKAEGFHADGSVVAADGTLWNAQYGAGRVAVYGTDGAFQREIKVPGDYSTCPAFGGADLTTLYCTSARQDHPDGDIAQGATYMIELDVKGQAEHKVIL